MMRRLVILIVLGAAVLAASTAALAEPSAATGLRLRIVDRDLAGRILLAASWPQGQGDPVFKVKVDGREVFFEQVGGGHGDGRSMADLAVVPHAFGRVRIEVTVTQGSRTRRARVSTTFRPAAAVIPNWVDSELVVGARALRFDFRHARIADVLLNGEHAEFGMEKNIPLDQTTYSVAILATSYRPGVNTVTVIAVDWRGETRTWQSSVFYTANGEITPGSVFNLMYGYAGSRSGPFYRVTTDAERLEELADRSLPDGKQVKTYRARGYGPVTITIEKKAHFRGSYEIERTIRLRVVSVLSAREILLEEPWGGGGIRASTAMPGSVLIHDASRTHSPEPGALYDPAAGVYISPSGAYDPDGGVWLNPNPALPDPEDPSTFDPYRRR